MFEKTRHRLGTLRAAGAFVSWRARGAYLWFLFAKLWGASRQVHGLYNYGGYLFDMRPGTVDRLALHPTHERETRRWLTTTFASSEGRGVFLDVGAHCGTYAIRYERFFASIVAFEPSTANAEALRHNVALNGLQSKIVTMSAAVAESPGVSDLFLGATEDRHSLLSSTPSQPSVQVQVTTLDRVLADRRVDSGEVRLVKVDVEGAEIEVLRGATHLLSHGSPAWIIEVNSPEDEKIVDGYMTRFGYHLQNVVDGRNAVFIRP